MESIGFIFMQMKLAIVTSVVGLIFAAVVWGLTRNVRHNRSPILFIAFLFPILAAFYLEGGLIGYGIIRSLLGQDSFTSGTYHYPLVNGYRVVIFDEMPEVATLERYDGRSEAFEFRTVQVSGNLIILQAYNSFMVIDSAKHSRTEYPSLELLQQAMSEHGIELHPRNVDELLAEMKRPSVLDWGVFALLVASIIMAAVLLIRRLQRLRRVPHPF